MVLTIAGFDPSGGAGIIADIRTIESFGCTAVAAITSVTFQNAEKFFGAKHQSAESVREQVEAITGVTSIAAIKIGMLPTAEVVREVARLIRENNLPAPVIDPVLESTSGGKLMEDDAFEVFVTELLPRARVVTPNVPEAEKLAGMNIRDESDMRQATARIRELGVPAVLIKGGHLEEQRSEVRDQKSDSTERQAIDLLDDDGQVTVFRSEWIEAPNVRGTGCMLSSAIAAHFAQGFTLHESVPEARRYVLSALASRQNFAE
ncbi:MAG TPA: bifunctional hydroxymethylpyrimidine kinase/phosphomethylpyrimidine kinase [Pyrinomonadaceae bacterium]